MKTKLMLIILFAGALFLGVAQHNVAQDVVTMRSMKGYELYSWGESGSWYFSLLAGTNRFKTREEKISLKVRVKGVSALKKKLRVLEKGDEVLWSSDAQPQKTFPPAKVIVEIKNYCAAKGIKLTVF